MNFKTYFITTTVFALLLTITTPIFATTIWTGSVGDTDWNNSNNWTAGVPNNDEAIVPDISPASNYPIIYNNVATIEQLTIESGAKMTITTSGRVTISVAIENHGKLFNYGSLTTEQFFSHDFVSNNGTLQTNQLDLYLGSQSLNHGHLIATVTYFNGDCALFNHGTIDAGLINNVQRVDNYGVLNANSFYGPAQLTNYEEARVNVPNFFVLQTGGSVDNNGLLEINELLNSGTIQNNSCGEITVQKGLSNEVACHFTNDGWLNLGSNLVNEGIFNNQGIIYDPANICITVVANSSFVNTGAITTQRPDINSGTVDPLFTLCGVQTIEHAIHKPGTFETYNWYADAAMTTLAGTFDPIANTFTPYSFQNTQAIWIQTVNTITGCISDHTLTTSLINTAPNVAATLVNACTGVANGAIHLATTTTANLTYDWSNGTSGQSFINNLAAGTYSVVITDLNSGCADTEFFTIETATMEATLTELTENSPFDIVSYELTISGGNAPYNYEWETEGYVRTTVIGEGYLSIRMTQDATFSVLITGANGCTTFIDLPSTVSLDDLSISQENITFATSKETANGAIDLTVEGGLAPYTYAWTGTNDFTANTEDISNLATGWYKVAIADADGNEIEAWFWVGTNSRGNGKIDIATTQELSVKAYPNPFVHSTTISYQIEADHTTAALVVLDMSGKTIAQLVPPTQHEAGAYQVQFEASQLPAGMYLFALTAGTQTATGQLVITK